MKIILEKIKCIGCGTCSAVCPDIFELTSEGKAYVKGSKMVAENEELDIIDVGCAKEASESCPAQCIKIQSTS